MAIKMNVYNQEGEKAGNISLSDKVFGVAANESLVHQAMVAQMSNERQVIAHTKGRSEVRGGGRKPWRQKGTGRARAGSNRSPIWRGGGVTFGPTNERSYKKDLNKKMKQKALLMVLSDKAANKSVVVLDKLEIKEYKTKTMNEVIANLEKKVIKVDTGKEEKKPAPRSVLIFNEGRDEKTKYSVRNIKGVKIINLDNINILDLLKFRNIVFTQDGIKSIEKRYK